MKRNLKKGIWYSSAPGKTVLEKFHAAKAARIPLHTSGKGRSIEVRRTFQSPCPYRS